MNDTSTPRWRWSTLEQAYVWWDGSDFTEGRAVFRDGRWQSTQPGVAPPDSPPPSSRRRVDGVVPGHVEVAPAESTARWLIAGLTTIGVGLLVWGGVAATGSPGWSYPPDQRGRYCNDASSVEFVSTTTWLVWTALLAVAAATIVVVYALARHATWARWMAGASVAAVVLTFPMWLEMGAAFDCGL